MQVLYHVIITLASFKERKRESQEKQGETFQHEAQQSQLYNTKTNQIFPTNIHLEQDTIWTNTTIFDTDINLDWVVMVSPMLV